MSTKSSDSIRAERAEIDAEIEGKTLCDLLARNADTYANRPAVSWKEGVAWRTLSWAEYRERVAQVAMGLKALGLGRGDFVAIMARNRPEHVIADLAVLHASATPVSFYNTLAPQQIDYIAGHCAAKVAILESREVMKQWEKVKADLPSLERVVLLEDAGDLPDRDWMLPWDELVSRGRTALEVTGGQEAFEETWRDVTPEDLATLVYTSGTTGPPKAVMLTERNVVWTVASLSRIMRFRTAVSYLPLAHIAERTGTHYSSLYEHGHVYFCPDGLRVFEVMRQVCPQTFIGVPRVWEKLQAGVMARLQAEPNPAKRKIGLRAMDVARRVAGQECAEKNVALGLKLEKALFDKLVYSKIRHAIGLDQSTQRLTGTAPISTDTLEFFWGIGLPLAEAYGMSESSGPATITPVSKIKPGMVGLPMPGVEVNLAADGEVLVRGGNVSPGYYKDPETSVETFDADGWIHTGDIGTMDQDGYLRIIDRKKELLITAGGMNVSPANLEALIKPHPLVGHVVVVGDGRPFVAALIVLDGEAAPLWAQKNGVPFASLSDFSKEPRVVAEVQRAVDDANHHLSRVEQVKNFTVLPMEWAVDSEELTPTFKLRRRVIHEKYAGEIERLYLRPEVTAAANSAKTDTTSQRRPGVP